jgi:hypothetical protein
MPKYGIQEKRELDNSYIKREDITDDINKTSQAFAHKPQLTEDEKNILYTATNHTVKMVSLSSNTTSNSFSSSK